ncbi:MAG: calcium-binding protein [Anaeromusa sp.]|uniref:beta strand repeat-containing protein n=1 Tax=Anaeromusa sp. TaxID=1872520 RepID=UPI002B1EB8AF|nr:calcium-binding protein [Anaeromusa sp.]MEA4836635.1 calcium-binding protein [Anaeromusa sp.]
MATFTYDLVAANITGKNGVNLTTLSGATANSDLVVTNTKNTAVAVGDVITVDDTNALKSIKYTGSNSADEALNINIATATAATISGGTGIDHVTLTGGTSTLVYDATDSVVHAGGTTTIDASTSTAAINWDLGVAANAAGGITYNGAGSTIAKDTILGVIGTQYADTITGGIAGAVTLNGGGGADKLYAKSAGTTTIVYDANDALVDGTGGAVELSAATNTAGIQLYLDGNTVFKSIETVTGGSGTDDLRGDASTTSINGGKGVDYIWGGLNNTAQTLDGGAGNDQYWFGAGEGTLKAIAYGAGQSAGDVVNLYNISAYDLVGVTAGGASKLSITAGDGVITNGTETLTMKAAAGATDATRHFVSSEGWAFDVVFGGGAGTAVTGTAGVIDNLVGGAAGNTFDGKGGNDNIYTSTGANSSIVYYAGDTIFSTFAGANTLTAVNSTAGVQMYMDNIVNTSFGAAKQAASWSLIGSAQDDEIRGQADVVAQTLNGGAGNDALWGGTGSANLDTLIGGAGADTYYYGIDEGNDVIQAGAAAATGNSLDTLNFYNVDDVSKLSGTLIPGGDMTISVTGAGVSQLTLQGWGASSGLNKLTNLVVNGKEYTLSADANNNAVFTAK